MKIIAVSAALVMALSACADPGPDYAAFIQDVDEVTVYELSNEDPAELQETVDYLCVNLNMSDRENTANIISLAFLTSPDNAWELVDSLDENICSRM